MSWALGLVAIILLLWIAKRIFRTVELHYCYATRASEPYYRTRCLTPADLDVPAQRWQELVLTSSRDSSVRTKGFVLLQRNAAASNTIVYCHGNGANVGDYLPRVLPLYGMGLNVVMGSYRGFGFSTGSPSQDGIEYDAQDTMDWVLSHRDLGQTRIILIGTSLGGSIAAGLARRNSRALSALVLDNTPLSFAELLPYRSPLFKALVPFMQERWDALTDVRYLREDLPVLVLVGDLDENVPPDHSRRLHHGCSSARKQLVSLVLGTHNDNHLQPNYYTTIFNFFVANNLLPRNQAIDERDVVQTLVKAVTIHEVFIRES